jgi:hypothetical protein
MSTLSFGQTNKKSLEADMYTAFHAFFDAEIRRQGVKLNWIFRLEEITGLHTFDINNDGLKEVLFEFDAVPVEGGGITNSYAVLFFESDMNKFLFGNYIETPYKRFLGLEDKVFRFYNRKINVVESYIFKDNKFKIVKSDY